LTGGYLGRLWGKLLNMVIPSISISSYALIGGCAFCAGVTHTVSVAVVLAELTGNWNLLLPSLLVCVVAVGVAKNRGYSAFDQAMLNKQLRSFQLLLMETDNRRFASDIMDTNVCTVTKTCSIATLVLLMQATAGLQEEFPIVKDRETFQVIGTISRDALFEYLQTVFSIQRKLPVFQALLLEDYNSYAAKKKKLDIIERKYLYFHSKRRKSSISVDVGLPGCLRSIFGDREMPSRSRTHSSTSIEMMSPTEIGKGYKFIDYNLEDIENQLSPSPSGGKNSMLGIQRCCFQCRCCRQDNPGFTDNVERGNETDDIDADIDAGTQRRQWTVTEDLIRWLGVSGLLSSDQNFRPRRNTISRMVGWLSASPHDTSPTSAESADERNAGDAPITCASFNDTIMGNQPALEVEHSNAAEVIINAALPAVLEPETGNLPEFNRRSIRSEVDKREDHAHDCLGERSVLNDSSLVGLEKGRCGEPDAGSYANEFPVKCGEFDAASDANEFSVTAAEILPTLTHRSEDNTLQDFVRPRRGTVTKIVGWLQSALSLESSSGVHLHDKDGEEGLRNALLTVLDDEIFTTEREITTEVGFSINSHPFT
jgi:hypothetical protein